MKRRETQKKLADIYDHVENRERKVVVSELRDLADEIEVTAPHWVNITDECEAKLFDTHSGLGYIEIYHERSSILRLHADKKVIKNGIYRLYSDNGLFKVEMLVGEE